MRSKGFRLLLATLVSAGLLLSFGQSAPAASAQVLGCTMSSFLVLGFQACPAGTVLNPSGVLVTPQGVLLTPQGLVITPAGHVLTPQGDEAVSHGELVSCVAQRAPRGPRHGQIVSSIARGDDNGFVDDPEAAAIAVQCLADVTGTQSFVGPVPAIPVNPGRDDDNRGRGPQGGGNSGGRGRH